MRKEIVLNFDIQAQPDDVTCGPTCLQALYHYYGDNIPMAEVDKEIKQLKNRYTLAVMLVNHAIKKDYKAHIYTYNLNVFDPSWFSHTSEEVVGFLKQQIQFKKKRRKLQIASQAYIKFLEAGGEIHYAELDDNLIKK